MAFWRQRRPSEPGGWWCDHRVQLDRLRRTTHITALWSEKWKLEAVGWYMGVHGEHCYFFWAREEGSEPRECTLACCPRSRVLHCLEGSEEASASTPYSVLGVLGVA